MFMSLIKLSSCRYYWSSQFRISQVAGIMTYKNFVKIKRFLHFANNADDGTSTDRLRKLRPLTDMLRHKFLSIPVQENLLSIDEQIMSFKGHHSLKQYLPKKQHKWGYKVFVLSGVSGFAYDIEVYSGKQDNTLQEGKADCGASGNVVVRLSHCIPDHAGHKLYFDNYFNASGLQVTMAKTGIWCIGTVRPNRLPNCQLPADVVLKKRGRRSHVEKVAEVEDVKMSVVRWYDKRPVTLLSTFVGAEPLMTARRWCKDEEKQVPCPKVVDAYNKHMGGVDLLDSLTGLYRCRIRSKKWYHRIFFHLVDVAVVNAWLLYRRMCRVRNEKALRLHDFKAAVAEGLSKHNKPLERGSAEKRSRRADSATDPTPVKQARPATVLPSSDVRMDQIWHFPQWNSSRNRCRRDGCSQLSCVSCRKCGVSVCFSSRNDCFFRYHN